MTFTIPGEPQGKGRPRVVRSGDFTRAYTPEKTASYENLVKLKYQEAGGVNFGVNTRLAMQITAWCSIPKSAGKTKQHEMMEGVVRPVKKPDSDNIAKVICDALNGIAYHDDTQIVSLSVEKWYHAVPHVTVTLEALP